MAIRRDGPVARATANTTASMRRNAAVRQCPACGRKSALTWVPDVWVDDDGRNRGASVCRWPDCRWDSTQPRPT